MSKDEFLKEITESTVLNPDFFKKVYGYAYTDSEFADKVFAVLTGLGHRNVYDNYMAVVADIEKKDTEATKNALVGYKKEYVYEGIDSIGNSEFGNISNFSNSSNTDKSNKLPFPIEALPENLRQYVVSVAKCLQVSVDMVAVAVIGIIALCTQGLFYVQPKEGWIEPLNLYILIYANPSERKTPLLKAVTEPIHKYVAEYNFARRSQIDEYQLKKKIIEKRISTLADKAAKDLKNSALSMSAVFEAQDELRNLQPVTSLKLIADDITPESLVQVMAENNEQMGIVTAEGGIFGMMAGRYSNQPNIDIFLKAYSGESYSSDRILRGSAQLNHPLMTMLILTQPYIVQEITGNRAFRDRGLLARFLYCDPPSMIGSREYDAGVIDNNAATYYDNLVHDLLSLKCEYVLTENVIYLDDDAYARAADFFYEIEKQINDKYIGIADWIGKFHGQTMRIAGILHCIKYGTKAVGNKIDGNTMAAAIQIGKYFCNHAMIALVESGTDEARADKEGQYILKKIDELLGDTNTKITKNTNIIKMQDLWTRCKGHFLTRDAMQVGLNALIDRNYIRIIVLQTGNAGRPPEFIEINPEYSKSTVTT